MRFTPTTDTLFYGDNLAILREHIEDASVDLVYLEKAIVSVKGGQRIGVGMVRELIATIGREGAKIGILLSLEEPTREMVREAVAAGLYKTEHGTFSRIQILTVAAVLGGARPQTPWLDLAGFRRTRREIVDQQGELGI